MSMAFCVIEGFIHFYLYAFFFIFIVLGRKVTEMLRRMMSASFYVLLQFRISVFGYPVIPCHRNGIVYGRKHRESKTTQRSKVSGVEDDTVTATPTSWATWAGGL